MEFLKALFESGALTYEQFTAKVKEAGFKVVNIADGSYISRNKFDDTVNGLKSQVADLQGQITQRDTDLAGLNDKLTAAKADAGKLTEAQKQLTALQTKYDEDSKAWEAKNARQAYEYAVRTAAGREKFSSTAEDVRRRGDQAGLQDGRRHADGLHGLPDQVQGRRSRSIRGRTAGTGSRSRTDDRASRKDHSRPEKDVFVRGYADEEREPRF